MINKLLLFLMVLNVLLVSEGIRLFGVIVILVLSIVVDILLFLIFLVGKV